MDKVLAPDVTVQLIGADGNEFAIIGRVRYALREAGYSDLVIAFTKEAISGNYDHLLVTCMKYVNVE